MPFSSLANLCQDGIMPSNLESMMATTWKTTLLDSMIIVGKETMSPESYKLGCEKACVALRRLAKALDKVASTCDNDLEDAIKYFAANLTDGVQLVEKSDDECVGSAETLTDEALRFSNATCNIGVMSGRPSGIGGTGSNAGGYASSQDSFVNEGSSDVEETNYIMATEVAPSTAAVDNLLCNPFLESELFDLETEVPGNSINDADVPAEFKDPFFWANSLPNIDFEEVIATSKVIREETRDNSEVDVSIPHVPSYLNFTADIPRMAIHAELNAARLTMALRNGNEAEAAAMNVHEEGLDDESKVAIQLVANPYMNLDAVVPQAVIDAEVDVATLLMAVQLGNDAETLFLEVSQSKRMDCSEEPRYLRKAPSQEAFRCKSFVWTVYKAQSALF